MNRGFKTYYKEGIKSAALTLRKRENFIKYYVHLFMNCIGRILCFVLAPVFDLSNVRLAKMVKKDNTIDISNTYKGSDNPKSVWTSIITSLISGLMYIGGIIIFLLVEGIVVLVGLFFSAIAPNNGTIAAAIIIILSIPVAIGLIGYLIVFPLYFAPTYYIIDSIEGVGTSTVLSKSIDAMRRSGKKTIVAVLLVNGLINGAYLGIVSLISVGLISGGRFAQVCGVLVAIIGVIVYLRFAPIFTLGAQISLVNLYEDLVVDKYNENKVAKGVFVKSSKTIKTTVSNYQDKLVKMFDEVEDVDISLLQMKDVRPVNVPPKKEVEEQEVHKIEEYTEEDLKELLQENCLLNEGNDTEIEVEEKTLEEAPKEKVKKEPFKVKMKRAAKKSLNLMKKAGSSIKKLVLKAIDGIKKLISKLTKKEEKIEETKLDEVVVEETKIEEVTEDEISIGKEELEEVTEENVELEENVEGNISLEETNEEKEETTHEEKEVEKGDK